MDSRNQRTIGVIALTALYTASGLLGVWLIPGPQLNVTPFWPPIGLALPLLSYGVGYWPLISIGSYVIAVANQLPTVTALGMSLSSTIAALLASFQIRRTGSVADPLSRVSDVLAFVLFVALVPTAVGAGITVLGFYVGGSLTLHQLVGAWWGWWLGDTASALLLAPALLVWQSPQKSRWSPGDAAKVLRLIALLVLVSVSVHSEWIASSSNQPPEYVFFPFVIWAALRFGQRGATLVTLVSSIIVIVDWKLAVGARPGAADIDDLLTIETFLCVLAVTGMVLAASSYERGIAETLARARANALARAIVVYSAEQTSLNDYFGHVLSEMVQSARGIGGALWLPNPEHSGVRLCLEHLEGQLLLSAQAKHPAAGRQLAQDMAPHYLAWSSVCHGVITGVNEPVLANDFTTYLQGIGARWCLMLPMCWGGKPIGCITIYCSEESLEQSEDMLVFAEAFASQAAIGMRLTELRDHAREAATIAERNRIARDLHDTLAQTFVGIIMQLRALRQGLDTITSGDLRDRVERLLNTAQAGLDDARTSVALMRPSLVTTTLASRLEALLDRATRNQGVTYALHVEACPRRLPPLYEHQLLRIVQEALTNMLKHAHATRCRLELNYSDDRLELLFEDDGVGFDPAAPTDGFGLLGMGERVESVGGTLSVLTAPGEGTTIKIAIDHIPIADSSTTS